DAPPPPSGLLPPFPAAVPPDLCPAVLEPNPGMAKGSPKRAVSKENVPVPPARGVSASGAERVSVPEDPPAPPPSLEGGIAPGEGRSGSGFVTPIRLSETTEI